jgi:hypothetical protein
MKIDINGSPPTLIEISNEITNIKKEQDKIIKDKRTLLTVLSFVYLFFVVLLAVYNFKFESINWYVFSLIIIAMPIFIIGASSGNILGIGVGLLSAGVILAGCGLLHVGYNNEYVILMYFLSFGVISATSTIVYYYYDYLCENIIKNKEALFLMKNTTKSHASDILKLIENESINKYYKILLNQSERVFVHAEFLAMNEFLRNEPYVEASRRADDDFRRLYKEPLLLV